MVDERWGAMLPIDRLLLVLWFMGNYVCLVHVFLLFFFKKKQAKS